jgi:hypothetical protein
MAVQKSNVGHLAQESLNLDSACRAQGGNADDAVCNKCASSLKIANLNVATPANAALEVMSETRAWRVHNVSTKNTITRGRHHIAVKAMQVSAKLLHQVVLLGGEQAASWKA